MLRITHLISVLIFFFSLHALEVSATQTYTVKKGDNLYKIAKKFKVGQEKIREANSLDTAALKPGIRLTIPTRESNEKKHVQKREVNAPARSAESAKRSAASVRPQTAEQAVQQETVYHTVKKGDTLASLSKKYSLSVKDIRELNNLGKSAKLKPGRQLLVKRTGPKTYTVKKGDTLSKIAKRFNVDSEEIMGLNELDSDELKPGQNLVLEEGGDQPDSGGHTVLAQAKLSEDIKLLAQSSELDSLGMKDRLILFAKKMLNIPYRFGGSTFMGIDCSGYVQKVFGFLDVSLPRTAREQFHFGEPVSKEDLSMGDLVFFRTYASFPSHVGIYLGNNLFIHASSRSHKVSIDSLDTPYYIKRFIGAKRLFQEDLGETMEFKDNS
ncbi:MAG TPA: LysM peptidoglycan-binding domain-containing protein [Thermodesulfovibrionales bacterium]|nr:LysM peptidoglycan-binding domain-containing protein [Thermodesulfovibrionales bacterium]